MSETLPVKTFPYQIDIAVVQQSFSQVSRRSAEDHVISLDQITIPLSTFKTIFYPSDGPFTVSQTAVTDPAIIPFVSFDRLHRTVNGVPFFLYNTMLENIEEDLGINRNMFSYCTAINLNKEINSLTTLGSLSLGNISCSLSWPEVLRSVKYEPKSTPTEVDVILTVSVVFVTPTSGVFPTVIRFNYRTTITFPGITV